MAESKSIDPKIAELAHAIYRALSDADPSACMSEYNLERAVIIDGDFHLYAVASLLLISLRDLNAQGLAPLEKMPEKSL